MLPVRVQADEPTPLDLFLARPALHVLALLMPVLAGILVNSPALAAGGAVLVVLYSNFLLRRRLLRLYNEGAYHRFLAMADRIQATFPLPFRPLTNLPELRAIARVKIGDTLEGKRIFQAQVPASLPPAFEGISKYNMAVMFLEMQDPASALELLDGLDEKARTMGDLFPLLRGAQLHAHFLRGELDRAAERLAEARAANPPPAAAVALDSWEAMLVCEREHDPQRALPLSAAACARGGEMESSQSRDWLTVNHAFLLLEAGHPEVGVLELLAPQLETEVRMSPYQRGLFHYVTARCHERSGQVGDAKKELEAAEAACRSEWLAARCTSLRERLAQA